MARSVGNSRVVCPQVMLFKGTFETRILTMKETYRSREKGYMEIVRDARKMFELAMSVDPTTGHTVLTKDDIVTILSQVDDASHFRDPMACALLDLVMERDGAIVIKHTYRTNSGSA